MRAAQLDTFGAPLEVREVPPPRAGVDEVVIRLTHAAVNPLDLRLCAGGAGKVDLPFVPGCDGVGEVDGSAVVVYGNGIGLRRPGTYAEAVAAHPVSVVRVPAGVDPLDAAGIGLAGVTAWGVVHATAALAEDDRLLVLGASGGVGTLVVQLARARGARVWAHVSTAADAADLEARGAHRAVVTDAAGLREASRELKPTVVVDALGGAFAADAVHALTPGGRLVVYGTSAGPLAEVDFGLVYRKALTIRGHAALATADHEVRLALRGCLELVAEGVLRPRIDRVASLGEVNELHAALAGRTVTGKLVLDLTA